METNSKTVERPVGYFGEQYEGIETIAARAERIDVPSDQLLMMSQVRSGLNPVYSELKESIRKNGLQSDVSLARLNSEELEEYIHFVNDLWGSSFNIDEINPSFDGYHYLVIAGHTRASIIKDIAEEDGQVYAVPCKVFDAKDPQEIIAHQLDENIHSKPAQEREAMAIVESYMYGQRKGLWSNKAEFLRSSQNKFSSYALNKALHFTALPTDIRQFILDGAVAYNVGVELGKAVPSVQRYWTMRYKEEFPEGSEDNTDKIAEAVHLWLQVAIVRINNSPTLSRSSNKAQTYVQESVKALEDTLERDEKAGNLTLFASPMKSETNPLKKELRKGIVRLSLDELDILVGLHHNAIDERTRQEVREDISKELEKYLGELASQPQEMSLLAIA